MGDEIFVIERKIVHIVLNKFLEQFTVNEVIDNIAYPEHKNASSQCFKNIFINKYEQNKLRAHAS